MAEIQGLSEAEAAARRARGQGNHVPLSTTRSYVQIVRENVFTFINNVLFALGVALVLLGRVSDAAVSVLVVLFNVLVSVAQEIRAKRALDRIVLLTRPKATVVRAGRERQADPSEVVLGDVLRVQVGDQIVVDGQVVAGRMDVDESLLTGESDLVTKRAGDPVYSGSFCVTGSAWYEAQKVGLQSYANQVTAGARAFRRILTPLQTEVNLVIRVLILVVVYIEILLAASSYFNETPIVESVKMSVVIAGLVPNGLFLAMAVAYSLGALRIARQGALVQQANAIESLSNVDVLCLDKTGTLTTNALGMEQTLPLRASAEELAQALGEYAASTEGGNLTIAAIAAALPGQKRHTGEFVPFASDRKWSALAFDDGERHGVYVLGAPEMLVPALQAGSELGPELGEWTARGLRVLLLAKDQAVSGMERGDPGSGTMTSAERETSLAAGRPSAAADLETSAAAGRASAAATVGGPFAQTTLATADAAPGNGLPAKDAAAPSAEPGGNADTPLPALRDAAGKPRLPDGLVPLGLVSFSDELRAEAQETLRSFAAAGIALKIISGDNPRTVAAVAHQAGLAEGSRTIAGPELEGLGAAELAELAENTTIFGRITPLQKQALVKALRSRGHYVAMIGDGVNDVLSLKQANLGIAMQSGSQATRTVADIVLLNDSFASLPQAFSEGQRILNGMQDILKIFLTRVVYVALLILSTGLISGFPFEPKQSSLLALLTVGIPTVALAAWAKPGRTTRRHLVRQLIYFVLPAAISISLIALLGYVVLFLNAFGSLSDAASGMSDALLVTQAQAIAQTGLTTITVFCGLLLLSFVQPPIKFFVGGDMLSRDWRPTILATILGGGYLLLLTVPALQPLFNLTPLTGQEMGLIALAVGGWMLVLRFTWRMRLLEKFISADAI